MGMPSEILMYNKVNYYNICPKIVRTNSVSTITIKQKYVTKYPQFSLMDKYYVVISPVLDFKFDTSGTTKQHPFIVYAKNGELSIEYFFESEQDYILQVWKQDDNGENKSLLLKTNLYALNEDLYDLIPLKGNMHLHSCFSDGLEVPLQHLGAALKAGFDFIALTDHNNFEGSQVAREYLDKLSFSKISTMLTVLSGEEFSCNFQPMHIISLGAKNAIPRELYIKNDIPLFNNEEEQYRWIIEKLDVLCNKIHEEDGLVVLCHPYWKPIFDWVRLDAPFKLAHEFIKTDKIDAFEVVSGSPKGNTNVSQLQYKLALESLKDTKKGFAFLGQSDSHVVNEESNSCVFSDRYTIVFSTENTTKGVLDAIKNKLTVAVEETDSKCEYYGSLRLVNFCMFLEKEYFPKAKKVKNLYHSVFEMCATGFFEDGKKLSDTLDNIDLFEYTDLKNN